MNQLSSDAMLCLAHGLGTPHFYCSYTKTIYLILVVVIVIEDDDSVGNLHAPIKGKGPAEVQPNWNESAGRVPREKTTWCPRQNITGVIKWAAL
jgi:hypothetical protein